MPLPQEIQNALQVYDHNKGFWRRLFRRDQAAIRALRTLSETDQTNLLKIYQCFIENLSKPTQASYRVYQAVLTYLNHIDFSGVPETMYQLHVTKLLKPNNLDKLSKLKGNHFRMLANLLNQLSECNLLTQANFNDIAKLFETRDDTIPLEFSVMVSAVDILKGHCLNQENFNSLLEKPMQAVNMATALKVLDSNRLLTSTNRIELHNDNNSFLLNGEAYRLVWHPLASHWPTLDHVDEKQSIFDRIIALAQQENPEEKIKNYMGERLNPGSSPRVHHDVKYNTAPAAVSRHDSQDNLIPEANRLIKQPTL